MKSKLQKARLNVTATKAIEVREDDVSQGLVSKILQQTQEAGEVEY